MYPKKLLREFAHLGASSHAVVICMIWTLIHNSASAWGLHLKDLKVPSLIDIRDVMGLECSYDMGGEELYAVKWYKDDHEFFRYSPHTQPKVLVFPVRGVYVLLKNETVCNLSLCKINLSQLSSAHSGGSYRCEVSTEAPSFRLAARSENVTVAALPRHDPKIEGLDSNYLEGDNVNVKCISDFADPAPILSWYINNQPAPLEHVGDPTSSPQNSLGLVSSSLTLYFQIERKHSRRTVLMLRCEAALPGIPLPPQVTTVMVPLRPMVTDAQVVQETKHLQWYSYGAASKNTSIMKVVVLSIVVGRSAGYKFM